MVNTCHGMFGFRQDVGVSIRYWTGPLGYLDLSSMGVLDKELLTEVLTPTRLKLVANKRVSLRVKKVKDTDIFNIEWKLIL